MKHMEMKWWTSEKTFSFYEILATEVKGSAGFRREGLELFLQGALLIDLSACKANFSTVRAFWCCSLVQKGGKCGLLAEQLFSVWMDRR